MEQASDTALMPTEIKMLYLGQTLQGTYRSRFEMNSPYM